MSPILEATGLHSSLVVPIRSGDRPLGMIGVHSRTRRRFDHHDAAFVSADRAFVAGLDTDARKCAIVESVLALGRRLGTDVVAEGVETDAELDALLALGCELAQGYGLARPMRLDDLRRQVAAAPSAARRPSMSSAPNTTRSPVAT